MPANTPSKEDGLVHRKKSDTISDSPVLRSGTLRTSTSNGTPRVPAKQCAVTPRATPNPKAPSLSPTVTRLKRPIPTLEKTSRLTNSSIIALTPTTRPSTSRSSGRAAKQPGNQNGVYRSRFPRLSSNTGISSAVARLLPTSTSTTPSTFSSQVCL